MLALASVWHMSGPPHLYAVAALSVAAMLAELGMTWGAVFRGGKKPPGGPGG